MHELLEEQIKKLALPAGKPNDGDDTAKEKYLSQYQDALKQVLVYLRDFRVAGATEEDLKRLFELLAQFATSAETLQQNLYDYFRLGNECYFDDPKYTLASLEIRGLIKRIQLYAEKLRAISGVDDLQPKEGLDKLIAATQCCDSYQHEACWLLVEVYFSQALSKTVLENIAKLLEPLLSSEGYWMLAVEKLAAHPALLEYAVHELAAQRYVQKNPMKLIRVLVVKYWEAFEAAIHKCLRPGPDKGRVVRDALSEKDGVLRKLLGPELAEELLSFLPYPQRYVKRVFNDWREALKSAGKGDSAVVNAMGNFGVFLTGKLQKSIARHQVGGMSELTEITTTPSATK